MATVVIKSGTSDNQADVTIDKQLKVTLEGSTFPPITAVNPSVGPNGDPAPDSSTLVAGIDPNGDLKPVTVDVNGSLVGGFSPPVNSDAIQASYPNPTTEVYAYYSGGLAGTLLQTVTVVYTDSTKALVNSVVKT